jgi:DnaJ-class molecular chaperone
MGRYYRSTLCSRCEGTGIIDCPECDGSGVIVGLGSCGRCYGAGEIVCPSCHGSRTEIVGERDDDFKF